MAVSIPLEQQQQQQQYSIHTWLEAAAADGARSNTGQQQQQQQQQQQLPLLLSFAAATSTPEATLESAAAAILETARSIDSSSGSGSSWIQANNSSATRVRSPPSAVVCPCPGSTQDAAAAHAARASAAGLSPQHPSNALPGSVQPEDSQLGSIQHTSSSAAAGSTCSWSLDSVRSVSSSCADLAHLGASTAPLPISSAASSISSLAPSSVSSSGMRCLNVEEPMLEDGGDGSSVLLPLDDAQATAAAASPALLITDDVDVQTALANEQCDQVVDDVFAGVVDAASAAAACDLHKLLTCASSDVSSESDWMVSD
jgi:hypothetical protein